MFFSVWIVRKYWPNINKIKKMDLNTVQLKSWFSQTFAVDESRFILQIIFCYNSGNTEKKWNAHDSEMLNIYIYMDNTIVLKY